MIVDSHVHLFPPGIVAGVSAKGALVETLHLEVHRAPDRMSLERLRGEARSAGVDACLLLPTASAEGVEKTNAAFMEKCRSGDGLFTAGTLHPRCPNNEAILRGLRQAGIRALKLCSFSQGFDLAAPDTFKLFDLVAEYNRDGGSSFFVVLDTFYEAHVHFGCPERHRTTPERLGALVARYPEIVLVGAHMGGLTAPFQEILEHLRPRENLYLETSNAAHTLRREEFATLLELHGPERILFGTDWPWFGQGEEMVRIESLMDLAGYTARDKARVFGDNAAELLGLKPC